jgi:tetratricopeptide (TPR) repeat protein
MELIQGRTLASWVDTNGALGPSETQAVGQALCGALAAVHAAGLVHGDVKTHNVMREDGGRVLLMDFGAGRAAGGNHAIAGTPLFLAPEVLAGGPPTARSDIYSLGVLLFYLLTKRYPYSVGDLDALREAHANGHRLWLRDARPELPAGLVHQIERALDPDPAQRFGSAGEVEAALSRALHPLEVESPKRPFQWGLAVFSLPGRLSWALALIVVSVLGLVLARVYQPFSAPAPRIQSIAVLPMASATDDDALNGLTTELARELQRYDVLVKRATPRRSNPPDVSPRIVADGSVRLSTSADHKKIGATVLRADGSTLWSFDYDNTAEALPGLARRISEDIATAIDIHPRSGAPSPAQPTNYRAYAAYQRGRALWEERTPSALARSIDYFKQAASLDPGYAEPWAGMADAYIALGVPAFGPLPPLEARRLAKESALKAIELDPNLAEAHTSLAFTAFLHDWDWDTAQARFDRALQLNPQYALAHQWYAEYLNEMGRFDKALDEIRTAQTLEPLSILIHRDIGWHLFCQRRYEEAIQQLRETLRLEPDYPPAVTLLARALAATGAYDEALTELRRAERSVSPGPYLSFRAAIEAAAGQTDRAEASLRDLRALSSTTYVSPYYVALIDTALGRRDEALSELERAYQEQDSTLVSVNIDPRFDPIRSDPRFAALIKKMRFPAPAR